MTDSTCSKHKRGWAGGVSAGRAQRVAGRRRAAPQQPQPRRVQPRRALQSRGMSGHRRAAGRARTTESIPRWGRVYSRSPPLRANAPAGVSVDKAPTTRTPSRSLSTRTSVSAPETPRAASSEGPAKPPAEAITPTAVRYARARRARSAASAASWGAGGSPAAEAVAAAPPPGAAGSVGPRARRLGGARGG